MTENRQTKEFHNGEYIAFLEEGDALVDGALELVEDCINNHHPDLIYSDEDVWDGKTYIEPDYKPDFSPDTLASFDYMGSFVVYKKSVIKEGLEKGESDWQLKKRASNEGRVFHIREILIHTATRRPKPFIHVKYEVEGAPLVSVIIPSKDNPNLVSKVFETVFDKNSYKNIEVILVDNGSNADNRAEIETLCKSRGAKYIYEPLDFNFSKMCNIGARAASGEYFLLLNDDIEATETEWLRTMLGQAMQPHVGAVGAKLLYPNTGFIQHAGVASLYAGPAHILRMHKADAPQPFNAGRADFNVVAVTAAVLVINAQKYREVGGFDESLEVAFNDVEFCFKLINAGYYNVQRNDVVLIHHESVSRGDDFKNKDKLNRMKAEKARLYQIHPEFESFDPFRHEMLNQFEADMTLNGFKDVRQKAKPFEEKLPLGSRRLNVIRMMPMVVGDRLMVTGTCVFPYNDKSKLQIVFEKSDGSRFVADAQRTYRPELKVRYFHYPNIAYASFRCIVEKDSLPFGDYNLYLLRHNKLYLCESLNLC